MIKHLLISFLALSITATAQAGIIVSGNIDDSQSLPLSLEMNENENNDDIFLYTEQENFLLTDDLNVDYLGSTTDAGIIASDTRVNSFYLNFDAEGSDYTQNSYNGYGSYLFDTKILGIIWSGTRPGAQPLSNGFLDLSDGILGLSTTTYPTGVPGATYPTSPPSIVGRGLEPEAFYNTNNTEDVVTVSNAGYQLDLSLWVKPAYADQLRVITAVPEPSTLVLFGAAALCLLNLRRAS
jgi:hypothetical protein